MPVSYPAKALESLGQVKFAHLGTNYTKTLLSRDYDGLQLVTLRSSASLEKQSDLQLFV